MTRVVSVMVEYLRDKNIFIFYPCKESRMFKSFLRKWDESFQETNVCTIDDVPDDIEDVKKSKVTFLTQGT